MIFQRFEPMLPSHAEYFQGMPCKVCADTKGIVAHCATTHSVMGLVAFDSWTENLASVHIKISNPMCLRNGGLIAESCDWYFNRLDRGIMLGLVRGDLYKVLAFNAKIGFTEEHRIKDGYAVGVDQVMLTMTREQCRFLPTQQRAA